MKYSIRNNVYISDIPLEEPEIIDINGLTEQERYKKNLDIYNDNFLRTDIILWKRKVKDKTFQLEEGWVMIPHIIPRHENYLEYLLDTMKENISNEKKTGWIQADKAGFSLECDILRNNKNDVTYKKKDYWIDTRLLGKKWYGLFMNTSADDNIYIFHHPGTPP